MPKKAGKKKAAAAAADDGEGITEAEAGIPNPEKEKKPKKKVDSKTQAIMDAIAEANAESDAQREALTADLAARLGDAIDRIGMLEARVTELERDAAAQRAGRAAFETEVREMASVEMEKRVGVAMQQIEVATHKLTVISSHMQPRSAAHSENIPPAPKYGSGLHGISSKMNNLALSS